MNYYISDLHFGHARLNEKIDCRGFESTEQMDEYMIAQWNSRVKDGDHVFILGDLSVSSQGEEVNQIFHRLKGRKTLLIGNHDTYLQDPAFDKGLLEQAVPYLELQDGRYSLVLSHYPILFYNGQYILDQEGRPKTYMLYGHVHNGPDEQKIREYLKDVRKHPKWNCVLKREGETLCQLINCFCMFSDYIPLTLEEWIVANRNRYRNQ
mgnify:FL=1